MELHSKQFGCYDPETNSLDVDNLCLEAFRTCEAKYWQQIVQGLVPNEDATALAFGKAIHAGRAAYRSPLIVDDPNIVNKVFIKDGKIYEPQKKVSPIGYWVVQSG